MTDLAKGYYSWLSKMVYSTPSANGETSYNTLLKYLFDTPFQIAMEQDIDRAKDGVYLRSLYFPERYTELNDELGCCRVFELMVALARRCEMDTMYNSALGNRTGQWFWEMIASMKLGQMTDPFYNQEYVAAAVTNWMNRCFKPNGEGGLFTVTHVTEDMRRLSIWKQMNLYLNEILMDEGLLYCT